LEGLMRGGRRIGEESWFLVIFNYLGLEIVILDLFSLLVPITIIIFFFHILNRTTIFF
jgi:hypothetical protein